MPYKKLGALAAQVSFALLVATLSIGESSIKAESYSDSHFKSTVVTSLPDLYPEKNNFGRAVYFLPGTLRRPTKLVDGKVVLVDGDTVYSNMMGPCEDAISVSCVAAVWAREANGPWVRGLYQGMMFEPKDSWSPDIARDLGSPRTSNLFAFPGLSHIGGNLFAVNPYRSYVPVSVAASQRSISGEIFPVTATADADVWGDYLPTSNRSTFERCLPPRTPCWRRSATRTPLEFRLEILTGIEPVGWLSGRMLNPSISTTQTRSSQPNRKYRVVIAGREAKVPQIALQFTYEKADERAAYQRFAEQTVNYCPTEFYVHSFLPDGFSNCFQPRTDMWSHWERWMSTRTGRIIDNRVFNTSPYQVHNLSRPSDFEALVTSWPQADRAFEERSLWRFEWSNSTQEAWGLLKGPKSYTAAVPKKCDDVVLYGTSFSNSTVQNYYLPQWNEELAALELTVASPHFSSGGTENIGFYEFSVSERIVRCAWGLGNVPLSLSATIIDSNETNSTSLAVVSVKDGFLKFSFTGFTYSTPKLLIRISKKGVVSCKNGNTTVPLRKSQEKCPRRWTKTGS